VQIRVTGVLIEGSKILILRQETDAGRQFSLPGGRTEEGEALGDALAREMLEETGLLVEPGRLLYLCDYLPGNGTHVVHVTFEVRRAGGTLGAVMPGKDTRPIRGVEFVPVADLPSFGFGERFAELARNGFPRAGSYMGPKSNIGLLAGCGRPVLLPGRPGRSLLGTFVLARLEAGDVAARLGSRLVELKRQLCGDFPQDCGGGAFPGQLLADRGGLRSQCVALGLRVQCTMRWGSTVRRVASPVWLR
jgi:ADP-ribose pyrophosphatase YjhB (NUDIX family)